MFLILFLVGGCRLAFLVLQGLIKNIKTVSKLGISWKLFLAHLTFFSMIAMYQNKSAVLYQESHIT